jgi:uncharacterized SAM-binding protein YcdF (DUF218 family)
LAVSSASCLLSCFQRNLGEVDIRALVMALRGRARKVLLIQGAPARVAAIVMLAGPGDRLPAALLLAKEHRAPVLVVSRGWMGYGGPCPPPTSGVKTICFEPNPGDTRGEAEFVAALAKREGWHSLLIVATRPQAVRSQLLFGRCFTGQVYVSTAPITVTSWPYQIAYGWGALLKAVFLTRSC